MVKGLVVGLIALLAAIAAPAAFASKYVVLYKQQAVPFDAGATIQKAGGTFVAAYPQIGVVIADSSSVTFRDNLLKDNRIENASSTAGFASQLPSEQADAGGPDELPPGNAPVTDTDTFSPLQWDMRQIKTPQAHAVTGGSPSVLVGDIDTGVDFNHPDLKQNLDVADSANCVSGAAVPGLAAQDDAGHGTHTAGTIAAAANGHGIVGVAPRVRLAAIKAGNAAGFFFPEAVICAFMWAGTHDVDVTNNSYFADPFLFNCRNDPVQRAIWKAEQRAILFAEQNGVSVVTAMGNESEDLAHPTVDATSPDDTTPITRDVTNACVVIPVEIPGVIGVTATGSTQQPNGGYLKSFYSNFGVGVTQLTAPGGDSVFRTAESVNGRVLSTYPANLPCTRSQKEPTGDPTYPTAVYCYLQGTSMAAPHVAGVAALLFSVYGDLRPSQVKAYLDQTADPQPCPSALPPNYAERFGVGTESGTFTPCQGGTGNNSWYGKGQVDALNAVTR